MLGPFDVRGVNLLEVLGVVLLAGATVGVLGRGGRAPWALRAGAGLALLAVSRFGTLLVSQWVVRSGGMSVHERIRVASWLGAGVWLLSTAGIGLLVLAVLTQRGRPRDEIAPGRVRTAQAE